MQAKTRSGTAVIAAAGLGMALLMSGCSAVSSHSATPPKAQPAAQAAKVTPHDPDSFDASSLPDGLKAAVKRDLGITPEQYLADAATAQDASAIIPKLKAAGIDPSQAWLDGSTLKVHVANAAQSSAVEALGATPTSAAVPNTFPQEGTVTQAYEDLNNGNGWTLPLGNGYLALCSVGFNGYTAAGAPELATAGHCLLDNNPVPAGTVTATRYDQQAPNTNGVQGAKIGDLDRNSFAFGNGLDSGLIPVTNANETPKPATSQWNGGTIAVRGSITATVGADICKSGRTTGWTCGKVLKVNYSQGISGGQTVNSVSTSMCMYHGDSGGSAMIGNYAVGINSSGSWSSAACTDASGFSAVYPVQGSAQSVTGQQAGWELAVTIDTPTVGKVTPGATTTIAGSLTNVANGDSVYAYVDGGTAIAGQATVATDGTWTISIPGLAAGNHTYKVVAGWGKYSRSAAATGTLTVPTGSTPAPVTPTPTPVAPSPSPTPVTPTPTPTPVAPSPSPSPVAPSPSPTPVAPKPSPTPVAPAPSPTPVAPAPAPAPAPVPGISKDALSSAIAKKYASLNGVNGVLGAAVGQTVYVGNPLTGAYQLYAHGAIYASQWGAAAVTRSDIVTIYTNNGGPAGALGWPVYDTQAMPSSMGTMYVQPFEKGSILISPFGNFISGPNGTVQVH